MIHIKRKTAVLAVTFDNGQFSALLEDGDSCRRVDGSFGLNPLSDDPVLVAQEWREQLAALGHLPRRIIVCLPLDSVLVTTVDIPEMPYEEIAGFLHLHAETEFMLSPADMAFGASFRSSDQVERATLMAMPMKQYGNLCKALRLQGWKQPLITVLPVPLASQRDDMEPVRANLLVSTNWIDLIVCRDRQIVLLRRLAASAPGLQRATPDVNAVSSELRMSLGQLPGDVRAQLTCINIIGNRNGAQKLQAALTAATPAGVAFVLETLEGENTLLPHAAGLAAHLARQGALPLTLLPLPTARKPHGWIRWNRRGLTWAAVAGMLLFVAVTAAIWRQHAELHKLQVRWHDMQPRTEAIREIISEAKTRDAWLSADPAILEIFRTITLAFPERGSVWATRVEVKENQQVHVIGKAVNREAWLQLLADLRRSAGISDLRVTQAREASGGTDTLTFALNFYWHRPARGRAMAEVTP